MADMILANPQPKRSRLKRLRKYRLHLFGISVTAPEFNT